MEENTTNDSPKVGKSTLKGNAGKGRQKGVPNKATKTAREAFAQLIEGNTPKMQEWLDKVAYGIPLMETVVEVVDGEEKQVTRQMERNGVPLWVQPPDPEKALDLLQKLAEYHVPKLARTEVVGDSQKPILHLFKWKDE